MSETPQIVAEFSDYAGFLAGLRKRAAERQVALSADENADTAGLSGRYLPKLIGANPIRRLGMISLGPVLGLLSVKCIIVEDEETVARYGSQLKTRNDDLVRGGVTEFG